MAKRFDPANWTKLEDPQRLVELPPSIIIDLLELRGDETLADFGAGTGMYSLSLAAAVPRGRVYAIEEQQPLLHRLQIKLDDQLEPGARITPVLTDGERIPLHDGVIDALVAVNVIHHMWDQPAALAELVRILRPGGRMVVMEWGDIERPVGPARDHVLAHDDLRRLIAGLGLTELAVHEPGALIPYYVAVVAEKPAAGDDRAGEDQAGHGGEGEGREPPA